MIPAGVEPATFSLGRNCSIQLSYGTIGEMLISDRSDVGHLFETMLISDRSDVGHLFETMLISDRSDVGHFSWSGR